MSFKKLLSYILCFLHLNLYSQSFYTPEAESTSNFGYQNRVSSDIMFNQDNFLINNFKYDNYNLKGIQIESSLLLEDLEKYILNFSREDIYANYLKNIETLYMYFYALNNITEYTNNIDKKTIDIVKINLNNYIKTVIKFKACKEDNRALCSSSISYLSNLDLRTIYYDGLKFINNIEKDLLKEIYYQALIQIGTSILEINYRLLGSSYFSVDSLISNLCFYDNNDICNKLNIKNSIISYFNSFSKNLLKSKKYSFNEINTVFNDKLENLNSLLKKVPVIRACDISVYEKSLGLEANKYDINKLKLNYRSTTGNLEALEKYTLNESYIDHTKLNNINNIPILGDLRIYVDNVNDEARKAYSYYNKAYFDFAKSLIGSIIFNEYMQTYDEKNKYYDQGLRTLEGSNALDKLIYLMTDMFRYFKDSDNLNREAKLLCSRMHKKVSDEQIKKAIESSRDNLIKLAKYINKSIYTKPEKKALKRMYRYSPYLIAYSLKNAAKFREDIFVLLEDIKEEDEREELTVNIMRAAAFLSILSIPFGGAGLWGSLAVSACIKGGAALTSFVSSLVEFRYANMLNYEKNYNSARLSIVNDILSALDADEEIRSSNTYYAKIYDDLIKEEYINKMMLSLEVLAIFGNMPDIIKYTKSLSRLNKLSKILEVDNLNLFNKIKSLKHKRNIAANLVDSFNKIKDKDKLKKLLAYLNKLDTDELGIFLETNAKGWSSKKLISEFNKILETGTASNMIKASSKITKTRTKDDIIAEFNKLSKEKDKIAFEKKTNIDILEGRLNVEGIDDSTLFSNGSFIDTNTLLNNYFKSLDILTISSKEKNIIKDIAGNMNSKEVFFVYIKDDLTNLFDTRIPWSKKEHILVDIMINSPGTQKELNSLFIKNFDRVIEFDNNPIYKKFYIAKYSDIKKKLEDAQFLLRSLGYEFEVIDQTSSLITYGLFERKIIRVKGIKENRYFRTAARYNENFIESESFYKLIKSGKNIDLDPGMDVIRSRAEALNFEFKTNLKRYIIDHEFAHLIEGRLKNNLNNSYESLFEIIKNKTNNNEIYEELIKLLKNEKITNTNELLDEYPVLDDIIFVLKKMYRKYKIQKISEISSNMESFFKEYIATRSAIKKMELNIFLRLFSKEYRLQKLYRLEYLKRTNNKLSYLESLEEFLYKILPEDYYKSAYKNKEFNILPKFKYKNIPELTISLVPPLILLNTNTYGNNIINDLSIIDLDELIDIEEPIVLLINNGVNTKIINILSTDSALLISEETINKEDN